MLPEQELMVEDESKQQPFARRLQDRIVSMMKVRRGLTVDRGAADHVLPTSWLTWMVLMASVGSLSGLHYRSAS